MGKVKSKETVSIQLRDIEIAEVHLHTPTGPLGEKPNFSFNINIEHRLIPEQALLMASVFIDVTLAGQEQVLGAIKSNIVFFIHEADKFREQPGMKLPDVVVNTINSIALSTARGILYCQFRGTAIEKALLPIIDPSAFVFNAKVQ